jgi:hypothetical protein
LPRTLDERGREGKVVKLPQFNYLDDIRGYADYRAWTLRRLLRRVIEDGIEGAKPGGA